VNKKIASSDDLSPALGDMGSIRRTVNVIIALENPDMKSKVLVAGASGLIGVADRGENHDPRGERQDEQSANPNCRVGGIFGPASSQTLAKTEGRRGRRPECRPQH
jgi:hypothetical protein